MAGMPDRRWWHGLRWPSVAIMANVAILGTGHMGAAMARRLLDRGHRVTVWNRSPQRAAALAGHGAIVAASPAQAVAQAGFVITMLTDAEAVSSALFADDGAARALPRGAIVARCPRSDPTKSADSPPACPRRWRVDAPVGGSVDAARAGTLPSSRAATTAP